MARPRKKKPAKSESAERARHLFTLEAAAVMQRLSTRQEEMVRLFSRHRSRDPLMDATRSHFDSVAFGELALLEPFEQRAVMAFSELLGELRWYLRYTEDMPVQVRQAVALFVRRLEVGHRALTDAIGKPESDGEAVVEAEVVGSAPAVAVALVRKR